MVVCEAVAMMKALVLCGLVVGAVAGTHHPSSRKMVPAVYVFGDSTLDVGNNNYLPGAGVPRANRSYYGVDFPGSKPTGRFSNGYNIADFIAKSLGFERSPMAYLGLKAHNYLIPGALTRGVSYASAGAGILDSTNAGNNIPLSQQVRYFVATKAEMESKVGRHVIHDLLSKSLFLLGVGSNDLFAFSTAQAKQNKSADVAALYTSLISNYSAAITDLYHVGARKFGIINVGPVGCVPRVRLLSLTGNCSDGLNQLAVGFNGALSSMLANKQKKLPGMGYSVADSYKLTQVTLGDPMAAGFGNSDSACCGSGRLGAQGECGPTASLCDNRSRYIFWDSVHTTQRAAKVGARAFYDGPSSFTTPINFKNLLMPHKM